ncbi:plasmid pRiA4b ORF-3 family protein [Mesorhizobium sp. M1348]|uniref:plasmid pRiA4b ORF-3 family protein n=1 Tax=Mesorhizobium sp. M1348 TaxID=2957089 RepID=UPI003339BF4F
MGWESIHLYQFVQYAVRYGSWETAARSPDVPLGDLRLRKGSRLLYEYDLNISWEHEVRLEDRFGARPGITYPCCTGGDGDCPSENCAGPETFMMQTDYVFDHEAYEDVALAVEACRTKLFSRLDDPDRPDKVREALQRIEARASTR